MWHDYCCSVGGLFKEVVVRVLRIVGGVVLVFFLGLSSSWAALVTCEPDDFAPGTALTSACPGVTLTVEQRADTVLSGLPAVAGAASTGDLVFVHTTDSFGWGSNDADPETFRADFASLTDHVSIDIIGNDTTDSGFLRAYDALDNLLFEILTGALTTGQVFHASITLGGADIAYIRASGNDSNNINLDNLQFEVVPEPGSLVLLGLGLLGLGVSRRRA